MKMKGKGYMETKRLNEEDVRKILPHGKDKLLVKVCEIKGKSACAAFQTESFPCFFEGHFDASPMLPASVLTEMAAQTAAVYLMDASGEKKRIPAVSSVKNMRFIRPVTPGEKLKIKCTIKEDSGSFASFSVKAETGEGTVMRGEITLFLK